jgi:replicative DNA helicase
MEAAMKLHTDGKFVAADTLPKSTLPAVAEVVAESAASMAYLDHYVTEFHQLVKYRRAQALAKKLAATTEDSDFESIFSKVVSEVEEVEDSGEAVSDIQSSLIAALAKIEEELSSTRGLLGFKTGYEVVSTRTQGCQKGQLWLLGGLPSAGKSLVAQTWAKNAMVRDDAEVHVVSLEMSKGDWMRRFISDLASVDINEAVMAKDQGAIGRMKAAASTIARFPFSISDKGGISLFTLKRQMKAEAKKGKTYFIIDHLGLLDHRGKEMEGYKQTTSWLKAFAKKADVFILVLCQLNGKGEQEAMDGKEPRQGHIAYGSSGPNQDADVIFIINREQELFCCKNRNGLMNWSVQLELTGPFCRITEAKYA